MEVTVLNISRVYARIANVYKLVASTFSSGEHTRQIVNSPFYDTRYISLV
jgi:hypothetical protein